jgi:hypothetical protein
MQVFGDSKWDGSLLQPASGGEVLGEHADRWRPQQQALGLGHLLL